MSLLKSFIFITFIITMSAQASDPNQLSIMANGMEASQIRDCSDVSDPEEWFHFLLSEYERKGFKLSFIRSTSELSKGDLYVSHKVNSYNAWKKLWKNEVVVDSILQRHDNLGGYLAWSFRRNLGDYDEISVASRDGYKCKKAAQNTIRKFFPDVRKARGL